MRLLSLALLLSTLFACGVRDSGEVAVIRVREFGEIRVRLLPELAPNHVANFTRLARAGFYDGTTFHRVIPGFMIQGGDPLSKDSDPSNDGTGTPGYFIGPEFSDRPHLPGTLSMARQSAPATAGSQFFLMTSESEAWRAQLDGKYTVFGELALGQEVIDRIAAVPRGRADRPLADVVIESISILPRTGKSAQRGTAAVRLFFSTRLSG